MNRMPQRHAAFSVLLLVIMLTGAVTPASADYYDHKGTFVIGGGWNNPTGTSGDYFTGSGTMFFAGGRHLNESTALQVEYAHHWMGIEPSVIQRANSDWFQFDHGTALFVEARYHHAYMPGVDMDLIPISFGFRW